LPLCSRRNYIAAQHQIFDVAGGNNDALVSVKANRLASVEESLYLLVDTADCLDLAALIDRTSDCEALLDSRLGQGREQREQLGGRRAVAIDPTIGLLEDEACIERERPCPAKPATQKSTEDQDPL